MLFGILLLVMAVFALSFYIRRWHDLGHSGWMSLLQLIPLVNLLVLIYLLCAKGEEGANAYGEVNVGQPFWKSIFGK